jgi:hypothetical protein
MGAAAVFETAAETPPTMIRRMLAFYVQTTDDIDDTAWSCSIDTALMLEVEGWDILKKSTTKPCWRKVD